MKTVGRIRIYFIMALLFSVLNAFSQGSPGVPGSTCDSAGAFCSENPSLTFAAGTGIESFQSNVGCLGTTPNPAWYKMQVSTSGRINIHMTTTPSRDLDFICWGPFNSSYDGCGSLNLADVGESHGPSAGANPSNLGGYPIGNIVDCSYTSESEEYVHIPNALPGQWYILLITNFSNQQCQISFGSDPSSTGSTNCNILLPHLTDTVCEGEVGSLQVSDPAPGAEYSWVGPNDFYRSGTSITFNTGPDSIFNSPPPSYLLSGKYYFMLTASRNGHFYTDTCIVIVHPKPAMTITTDSICVEEIATLNASGADTYHWSNNETSASINVSPDTTTQYSVKGTNVWGCKDSAFTQVVVYKNPVITLTPDVMCSGDTATVFAPDALSYTWDKGLGSDTTVFPTVTDQQIYTVKVVVSGGCRDSVTLMVNPNPIVEATAPEICAGETSVVSAKDLGVGNTTFNWSNFQSGESIAVSPMTNMALSVVGTNQYGCTGKDEVTVVVHPTPVADFNPNEILVTIDNGEITFTDNSTDASIWSYNFGEFNNDLNISSEQSPTHKYLHVGYFNVWQVVSTEFGCVDSTYRRVQVMAPYFFYVPNAFTPDHDGKNEYFCPSGKGIDPNNYSMEIFDRWGTLIFHTNTLLGCWDGTINGVRAPEGSYIFKIKLRDMDANPHDYMGDFVLLR